MEWEVLGDFVPAEKPAEEQLTRYEGVVPPELLEIWKEYGFGSFFGGFLKIVDPADYAPLLEGSYFRADIAVPILVTAFGQIITWEKQRYVSMVDFTDGSCEILIPRFGLFLRLLKDQSFLDRFFRLEDYREAVEKLGELPYDRCFGYAPLPALGGRSADHLKQVKTREYIALNIDMVGGI